MRRLFTHGLLIAGLAGLASNAFSAQLTFTPFSFARERTGPRYTIPPGRGTILYQQSVYRGTASNFLVRLTLSDGAIFTPYGPTPGLAYANNAGGSVSISPVVVAANGTNYVEWLVIVTAGFTELGSGPPKFSIETGDTVVDCGSVIAQGGAVSFTISAADSGTAVAIEPATTEMLTFGAWAIWLDGLLTSTTAEIDINNEFKTFVPNSPDTATQDRGATVPALRVGRAIHNSTWVDVYDSNGSVFQLLPEDQFELTFTSNLSAISRIHFAGWTMALTDEDRASGAVTMGIAGDQIGGWTPVPGQPNLALEVSGESALQSRVLTMSASLYLHREREHFLLLPFSQLSEWHHLGVFGVPQLQADEVLFAREAPGPFYTLPACTVTFKQSTYRATGMDFMLRIVLRDGASFAHTSPTTPQLFYPSSPQFPNGGGQVEILPLVTAAAGLPYVEWQVRVVRGFSETGSGGPLLEARLDGVKISAGDVLSKGGMIGLTVTTRDVATGLPFENTVTAQWLKGIQGVFFERTVKPSSAIVDLNAGATLFAPSPGDTSLADNGAALGPIWVGNVPNRHDPGTLDTVYGTDGRPYVLSPDDQLKFTFSSKLTQLSSIEFGSTFVRSLTDSERIAPFITVSMPGSEVNGWSGRETPVSFVVTGNERIETRVLEVSLELDLAAGEDRILLGPTVVTTWLVDGTILSAQWVNGNDAALHSRLYMANLSGRDASVRARVLSLPRIGSPTHELGTVELGVIPKQGALSVNVAEDILAILGLRPYVQNGGNLAIQLLIPRAKVTGVGQTFFPGGCYGTYPLSSEASSIHD